MLNPSVFLTSVAELLFQLSERSFKSSFPAPCRAPGLLQKEMNAHSSRRSVGVKFEITALADLSGTNNNNYANMCPFQMSGGGGHRDRKALWEIW